LLVDNWFIFTLLNNAIFIIFGLGWCGYSLIEVHLCVPILFRSDEATNCRVNWMCVFFCFHRENKHPLYNFFLRRISFILIEESTKYIWPTIRIKVQGVFTPKVRSPKSPLKSKYNIGLEIHFIKCLVSATQLTGTLHYTCRGPAFELGLSHLFTLKVEFPTTKLFNKKKKDPFIK
jgi:hypothetical protein